MCAKLSHNILLHIVSLLFVFVSGNAMAFSSDAEVCRGADDNAIPTVDARYRAYADMLGKTRAPNERIILCEGESREHGDAFSFVVIEAMDIPVAWGIVLSARIVRDYSDLALRGLVGHELAHIMSGIGNCNGLIGNSYSRCEEGVDEYAGRLAGNCAVLEALRSTANDYRNGGISAEMRRSLSGRIRKMEGRCSRSS